MLLFKLLFTAINITIVIFTFWTILNLIYKKNISLKHFFLKIYAIGLLYYSVTLSWILTSYPLNDFGLGNNIGLILLLSFFSITVFTSACAFVLFYFLKIFIQNKSIVPKKISFTKIFEIIIFSGIMVCISYLMSLLLYIVYYSPNFSFGWYCIFGDPALSLIFTPFSYLYQYIGITGVDFVIGVTIISIYFSNKKTQLIILAVFIFSTLSWIIFIDQDTNTLSLGSTKKNGYQYWENFNVIPTQNNNLHNGLKTVEEVIASSTNEKVYLVPEGIGLTEVSKEHINKTHSTILYGRTNINNSLIYNTLSLIDNQNYEPKIITEKKYLVQNGEYIPIIFKFILLFTLKSRASDYLFQSNNIISGRGLQEIIIGNQKYVVGLCSDFWSREGIAFSRSSNASKGIIFESNSRFHSNKWFLINLYAWHKIFAKASHKNLLSVPNDSPLWEINFK